MRLLALLIPLMPTLFGSSSAPVAPASSGTVLEHVDFAYYEIEGESRQALAAALATNGPEFDGHRFFGMTEWSLSASYRAAASSNGCALSDVEVKVDVETRLPYWRRSGLRNATLRTDWYRFLGALDRHEGGHRTLAREAADAVRQHLVSLTTPSCEGLRNEAQRVARAVMSTYDARHRAYDASTGHGYTQGAVWPPIDKHPERLLASAD